MKNKELTEEFMECIEDRDFNRVEELMDDSFVFEGATPEPQDKDQFLEAHQSILDAFSDFNYNLSDLKEKGNTVSGTVQIEGRHTGPLDLSFMDGPMVEATEKKIKLPKEPFTATVINGKVTKVHSTPPQGGGMNGLLKAIGAEVPERESAE